jgi:hypothetical protein
VRTRRPEQELHHAVVAHLKARGAPGLFWFHVPSGAFFGGKRQGAIMKSLGWMAGLPDLFLVHQGRVFALELKIPGGRLSPAQEQVLIALRAAGASACHCHGLTQALRLLEGWKLLRGQSS